MRPHSLFYGVFAIGVLRPRPSPFFVLRPRLASCVPDRPRFDPVFYGVGTVGTVGGLGLGRSQISLRRRRAQRIGLRVADDATGWKIAI